MLKIKDNVDLKVLEKFGFEFINGEWSYVEHSSIINVDFTYFMIIINPKTREFFYERVPTNDYINVIFDLIQANLVEKVVNNG